MSPESRQLGRAWIAGALVLAVGMAFGGVLRSWTSSAPETSHSRDQHAAEEEGHAASATGVVSIPVEAQIAGGLQTEQAVVREIESRIQVSGVVTADQGRIARVRPPGSGIVEEVLVGLGDRVKAGDPLVSYDNIELGLAISEFLSAHADLRRWLATLKAHQTVLARSEQMLKVGAIARTEHDIRTARQRDAQAQVDAKQAWVSQFEEQLHRFGLTEEDVKRLNDEDDSGFHRTASISVLHAPAPGIVTAFEVSPGESIDQASELFTITDISSVWVLAEIYEHDLGSIRVGKDVSVLVPAYPDAAFRGRVTYISDTMNLATQTARVRCVVGNSEARLKLGMFASVEIPVGSIVESLAVPSSAIQTVSGRPVVFVKRSGSTFELAEVETGAEADGWIEIREGLSSGDTVITEGSFYAKTATLRELIGHSH